MTTAVIAGDAAVDANIQGDVTYVGKGKTVTEASVDVAAAILPGKAIDQLTEGFTKALTGDLTANSAATMTKQTKAGLKRIRSTINGTKFQNSANGTADYAGGTLGTLINDEIAKKKEASQEEDKQKKKGKH